MDGAERGGGKNANRDSKKKKQHNGTVSESNRKLQKASGAPSKANWLWFALLGEDRVGSPLDTITPPRGLRANLVFLMGTGHNAEPYIPSTRRITAMTCRVLSS